MNDPALVRDLELLEPDLIAIRRDLHRHPELGWGEQRTAQIVADRLTALGLSVRTGVGRTGVTADLQGPRPGPTLLLRADMDALPVQETTGHDFASAVPGVMHACGHDAHVAALLGAATLLSERREQLAGRVRFCFQPAEELMGGAARMIEEGVLDGVDRALGLHVFSSVPTGIVICTDGDFMAGCTIFELEVIGRAGHGGMPQTGVDPIYAAAQVVTALQSIVARETDPNHYLVVSVAAISGGTASNVVVESVTLKGTVRWYDPALRDRALERIDQVAGGVCSALRATHRLTIVDSVPVTHNAAIQNGTVRDAVQSSARTTYVDSGRISGSEDFSLFCERVPGAMFGVGCGGPGAAPHHHHAFDVDERAIANASEVFALATLHSLSPDRE